jgi:lipoprotein Spr
MMIYKCIIVILFILLPSLGLAQNPTQTNQSKEQQNKIEYLNQIVGIALDYTPVSLKLHDFIFDWIGKPYRFGGNSKKGIDCSSLVRELYSKVFKISLPRNSIQQFKYVKPINKNELQTGDLVFFKIKTKQISHVGVYLGEDKFFQVSNDGVNISSLQHPYWKKYYYKGGRVN